MAIKDFNKTFTINQSQIIGLSYFSEDLQKISFSNLNVSFEFAIPMNSLTRLPEFVPANNSFSGFNLPLNDVAIQIHIKPNNISSSGFLFALKFGSSIFLNTYDSTNKYDFIKILCPNELKTESDEAFYSIFISKNQIKNFTGFIGYDLREINCSLNKSNLTFLSSFSSINYSSRVIITGCYYISNELDITYSSDNLEILETSNLTHTRCLSNHLTQFAGGFITLPPAINFADVFARASFAENLTIYLTVIISTAIYIILFVWTRYMDSRDKLKNCIKLLKDNHPNDVYFYEVLFYTGSSIDSATDSTVRRSKKSIENF